MGMTGKQTANADLEEKQQVEHSNNNETSAV
jgi:hypothetical protein